MIATRCRNSSRKALLAGTPTTGSSFDANAASIASQSSGASAAAASGSTSSSSLRMCRQWKCA